MIILVTILLIAFIIYKMFPFIQVCGDSMYPTYLDSEILVGTKLYRKSKLKVGDVILYKCPTDTERVVIKRIQYISYINGVQCFYCLGDNRDNSHDSRDYGLVHSKYLVCKVINQRRNIYYECN